MKHANPFPHDADRGEIWEILMRRDFEAFLDGNWNKVAPDFLDQEFQGINADKLPNPDRWKLQYPDLASYRDEWLRQAEDFRKIELIGVTKLDFLFEACILKKIQLQGSRAMAHKKFDGAAQARNGDQIRPLWQTLYFLKKTDSRWKITGFVGYLPNSLP